MQTLVLKFFMGLKHMNCLLNVINKQNSEISWPDIWKKKLKVEVLEQSIQI